MSTDEPRTQRVPIPGGELFVRSVGATDAPDLVVLIHGGPGISHRYMRGLERLAGPRRQVVSYDQRGVGESPHASTDPDDYGLDAQAADLEAVIAASGDAARVHLLGHSWGGVPAMDYAGRHPERVASLLLVDSCPPTIRDLEPGYGRFSARVGELMGEGRIPAALPEDPTDQLRAIAPVYFADPDFTPSPEEIAALEVFATAGELTSMSLSTLDLTDAVARFEGPVLIVIGRQDPFGVDWATATQRAFTRAQVRFEIVEECGHLGWMECPERLLPVLESFLDGVRPAERGR